MDVYLPQATHNQLQDRKHITRLMTFPECACLQWMSLPILLPCVCGMCVIFTAYLQLLFVEGLEQVLWNDLIEALLQSQKLSFDPM